MSVALIAVVTLVSCFVVIYELFKNLSRRHAMAGTLVVVGLMAFVPSLMVAPVLSESRHPVSLQDVAYQTSVSCKKCHAGHYESWHQTFHRSMTQEALPQNVLGDFDDVTLTFKGFECHFFRQGDRFFMNLIDSQWESAMLDAGRVPSEISSPPRVTYSVDRLVGSHVMQVYLTRFPNGEYWALPLVWNREAGRWITSEGSFLAAPSKNLYSFAAPWNANCAFCHNTRHRPGLLVDPAAPTERYVFESRLEEIGIACEACHGPGDLHVRANWNPGRRYALREIGRTDPTIVNPAKLSQEASTEVCGRCHGKWQVKDEFKPQWLTTGDLFVPGGDPLATHYNFEFPFPTQDGDDAEPLSGYCWPDWTPQTSAMEWQGLQLSPCFERGTMTCVSCHSMHRSDPEDQLIFSDNEDVPSRSHNAACLNCHEQFSDSHALMTHTHHGSESSGSRCYNCHMPYQAYGLLKGIRSHRISNPSAHKTAKLAMPNACNQCHVDQTLHWTAQWLARWYDHEVPALSEQQQQLSATMVDALQGHALSRALAVSRLGWKPAQEAAPGRWPVPLLARSLDDTYAAVRFIAYRSLRTFSGFETAVFDYLANHETRREQIGVILDHWRSLSDQGVPKDPRPILLGQDGLPDTETI